MQTDMTHDYEVIGICFQVTSKCNLKCPICFVELNKYTSQDYDYNVEIINKLKNFGVKKINFTGGEALTYKHIIELATYTKKLGIKSALSTNGILLKEQHLNCFDEISISVDAIEQEVTNLHRTSQCRNEIIIKSLELSLLPYKKAIFEIATVVTNKNINQLYKILNIINKYSIKKWKLYQYSSLIQKENAFSKFKINTEEFYDAVQKIQMQIDIYNLNIEIDYRYAANAALNSYITVFPDGSLALSDNNKYKIIGHILSIQTKHEFYKLLKINNFNFKGHKKRHFRDVQ